MTLSAMSVRTNWMLEQMRLNAIDDTLTKWREAIRNYYMQGYDNGESVKLYKQLEEYGVDQEQLIDEEFASREEVLGF